MDQLTLSTLKALNDFAPAFAPLKTLIQDAEADFNNSSMQQQNQLLEVIEDRFYGATKKSFTN